MSIVTSTGFPHKTSVHDRSEQSVVTSAGVSARSGWLEARFRSESYLFVSGVRAEEKAAGRARTHIIALTADAESELGGVCSMCWDANADETEFER